MPLLSSFMKSALTGAGDPHSEPADRAVCLVMLSFIFGELSVLNVLGSEMPFCFLQK